MDVTSFSADQILQAPLEVLFPGNEKGAKQVYRDLSKRWHPDVADGNRAVFDKIASSYRETIKRIAEGRWRGRATYRFETMSGKSLVIESLTSRPFTLGHVVISHDAVSYFVDSGYKNYVDNFMLAPGRFFYASARMKEECERYLPTKPTVDLLSDGRFIVRVPKNPDLICLHDVINHYNGIEPRHTAWIVSSLMNLTCYLAYTRISHQDISPYTYFICPQKHSGALLGGWWWTQAIGSPITTLPQRTANLLPFSVSRSKISSSLTDSELVRDTGIQCLKGKSAPAELLKWLRSVQTTKPSEQYAAWSRVLERSFGPRRFVEMVLTAEAVYG